MSSSKILLSTYESTLCHSTKTTSAMCQLFDKNTLTL
jgi:hypothetical protein